MVQYRVPSGIPNRGWLGTVRYYVPSGTPNLG